MEAFQNCDSRKRTVYFCFAERAGPDSVQTHLVVLVVAVPTFQEIVQVDMIAAGEIGDRVCTKTDDALLRNIDCDCSRRPGVVERIEAAADDEVVVSCVGKNIIVARATANDVSAVACTNRIVAIAAQELLLNRAAFEYIIRARTSK